MNILEKIKKFYELYEMRIVIGATVLMLLSIAAAINVYGNSKYEQGVSSCVSVQQTGTIQTLQTDNQIWKEVTHETSKITDRVAAGAALGILRADSAR